MQTIRSILMLLVLGAGAVATAQVPEYTVELLGPAVVVNDMNHAGAVVGWTLAGGVQAYVAQPAGAYQVLPLPAGYSSAWAQGINDAGVVVGSASAGGTPESGQALAWIPDGAGGYTMHFLGALPGHTQSVAYAINNRGDIVGTSIVPGFQGGPTVWFNSSRGILDISAFGAPSSPKQISDKGVIVGINGGLFEVDTLLSTSLPTLPSGWSGFQGWAINEHGELAGTAIHGSLYRSAAIWTLAGGWQSISSQYSLSASVQAFDINDAGIAHAEVPQPSARFPGMSSTVPLGSLLTGSQQGSWAFITSLGGAVNGFGQIAAIAQNTVTGQSGVVLLTPAGCVAPLRYCASTPNSSGAPAAMGWAGPPSLSLNSFELRCTPAPANVPGLFYYGPSQLQVVFGDGFRCVDTPFHRLSVLMTSSTGLALDVLDLPAMPGVTAGVTQNFQFWFRDSGGPGGNGSNLSDGLQVTFCY